MMSQNRQAAKDSLRNQNDYRTDLKSELILEELHDKMELILKNRLEYDSFMEYLTINVSEFFRNGEQWDVLKNEILPILVSKSNQGKLRIWSSACSSGEEPYSLAMVLTKHLKDMDFEIIATDIDESIMARAKKATYKLEDFGKIPEEYRKWFIDQGCGIYGISDEIKKKITFSQLDLLKDIYPKDVDLLVCRNVLIYFTEEAQHFIVENTESL